MSTPLFSRRTSLQHGIGAVIIYPLAVLIAAGLTLLAAPAWGSSGRTDDALRIGFFSPLSVDDYAYYTDFSVLLAPLLTHAAGEPSIVNTVQLRANLEAIRGLEHKIHIDIGGIIAEPKRPDEIGRTCVGEDGVEHEKIFAPLANNKLRRVVSDEEIKRRLQGLAGLIREYRRNVGILFLVDEPYLNGISRTELERAARTVREVLAAGDVADVELGVIFAAGMFNRNFAAHMQRSMAGYVAGIDEYYRTNRHLLGQASAEADAFSSWVEATKTSRITTYDTCGNMYTGGGLPQGVDVVAFDFYLSTLLLDTAHETTLSYLARSGGDPSCAYFADKPMSTVRKSLTFFSGGRQDRTRDRTILARAFDCRMRSVAGLMLEELRRGGGLMPRVMLIGEASASGGLGFREEGAPGREDRHAVQGRMLDEVKRSLRYYTANRTHFQSGLMLFLYPDAVDNSIGLRIRGAKGARKVTDYVRRYRRGAAGQPQAGVIPRLVSLGAVMGSRYVFSEDEARRLLGQWYVMADPVVVMKPRSARVSLAATSSNPEVIETGLTPDSRLMVKWREGAYGEAVITVTAATPQGVSDVRSFSIVVGRSDNPARASAADSVMERHR